MRLTVFVIFFLCLLIGHAAAQPPSRPRHELSVSFRPEENLLLGRAVITLPQERQYTISTGALTLTAAFLGGRPLEANIRDGVFVVKGAGELSITYEGVFSGSEAVEALENVGVSSEGIVSERGIALFGAWYPRAVSEDGLAYYRLTALLPEGFSAVSEAEEITSRKTEEGVEFSFSFPHPVDGINLAAAKYVELRDTADGIDIYGYFFPEDEALAATYLEYTKTYIRKYEELIGKFPYRRFSVVENILPTGYSMPTFTLLGSAVVRLPFIVETSLGHEILHQWLGNSVYGDHEGGNWVEGLTAYLSDHLYEEEKGQGPADRKKILLDYRNYVDAEEEFPLREFVSPKDFATRAVGYGKGAMVFHMLKDEVGEDAFVSALRELNENMKFRKVSWNDLEKAFGRTSGKDLGWFFEEWLTRKGVLSFTVQNPRVLLLGGTHQVEFTLRQRGEPYRFLLPVSVLSEDGETTKVLEVKKETETFRIDVGPSPKELVLDPGYDLMRGLFPAEAPPVVSGLTGSARRMVVVPAEGAEKYETLVRLMEENGFTIKPEAGVKDKDLMASSALVLGLKGPVIERLFGEYRPGARNPFEEALGAEGLPPGGFGLAVLTNPLNTSKVVAAAYAESREEADLAARKIFRYGKYSVIRFKRGENIEKAIAPSQDGMRVDLTFRAAGVEPGKALSLDDVIGRVMDRTVIYVGEAHPEYQDHKIQLAVIEALHRAGRPFGIGMEMFQRPFQKPLDSYLAGEADEKEFLRESEYYKRWRFNYHLYREILDFAKTNGIPVIALNQKAEIIKKVAGGGLDSLNEEERAEVPEGMDMSDYAYRERLREVFRQHKNSRTFENFYQAQILWDETMAHAVDGFLRENPGLQMVVLAGGGHVAWGSGIPRRAYRLSGRDYAILLASRTGALAPGVADYVLFAEHISAPESPALGVMLKTEDGGLTIKEVSAGSAADTAGLKKKDVILMADGVEVKGVEDLKVALFDRKPGDTMTLKVKRKRAFRRDKEIEVTVTFP